MYRGELISPTIVAVIEITSNEGSNPFFSTLQTFNIFIYKHIDMANLKISEEEFKKAAEIIGCEVAIIKAVAKIESNGSGFNSDGTPKTLFEGHWFHKLTNGKFSDNPKYASISYKKWTRKWYGNQTVEKQRLDLASTLDRDAALQSASWGAFQIMGFNYKVCGFTKLQDFINAMYGGEGTQLLAFIAYIKNRHLDDELRDKDWARFAYYYNGSGYAVNKYDEKMAAAYKVFKAEEVKKK